MKSHSLTKQDDSDTRNSSQETPPHLIDSRHLSSLLIHPSDLRVPNECVGLYAISTYCDEVRRCYSKHAASQPTTVDVMVDSRHANTSVFPTTADQQITFTTQAGVTTQAPRPRLGITSSANGPHSSQLCCLERLVDQLDIEVWNNLYAASRDYFWSGIGLGSD